MQTSSVELSNFLLFVPEYITFFAGIARYGMKPVLSACVVVQETSLVLFFYIALLDIMRNVCT